MTLVTIWFLIVNQFNWLAFAMTFTWGCQDGAVNVHTTEMLGFEFEDSVTPFAIVVLV